MKIRGHKTQKNAIRVIIQVSLNKIGFRISRFFPKDLKLEKDFVEIYNKCVNTTTIERMYALYNAVKYIIENNIKGDFVECGVAGGESCKLIALTLIQLKEINRKIYLYDTYKGMPKPIEKDGGKSMRFWKKYNEEEGENPFAINIRKVKKNMYSTGYPKKNLVFVQGKVEDTIPKKSPNKISLLRIDTDWYESTYHILKHLYPILAESGVVLEDDYALEGARKAINKYIKENKIHLLLNRIDGTGRIGIKSKI